MADGNINNPLDQNTTTNADGEIITELSTKEEAKLQILREMNLLDLMVAYVQDDVSGGRRSSAKADEEPPRRALLSDDQDDSTSLEGEVTFKYNGVEYNLFTSGEAFTQEDIETLSEFNWGIINGRTETPDDKFAILEERLGADLANKVLGLLIFVPVPGIEGTAAVTDRSFRQFFNYDEVYDGPENDSIDSKSNFFTAFFEQAAAGRVGSFVAGGALEIDVQDTGLTIGLDGGALTSEEAEFLSELDWTGDLMAYGEAGDLADNGQEVEPFSGVRNALVEEFGEARGTQVFNTVMNLRVFEPQNDGFAREYTFVQAIRNGGRVEGKFGTDDFVANAYTQDFFRGIATSRPSFTIRGNDQNNPLEIRVFGGDEGNAVRLVQADFERELRAEYGNDVAISFTRGDLGNGEYAISAEIGPYTNPISTASQTFKVHDGEVFDTSDVQVGARSRNLRDDSIDSEADGIISGATANERQEDARVERVDLIWTSLLQSTGGGIPKWTAEQWFNFTFGVLGDGEAVTGDILEGFFAANFDAAGNFVGLTDENGLPVGDMDLSMIPEGMRDTFIHGLLDGTYLFHSAQQNIAKDGEVLADGTVYQAGSLILPDEGTQSASLIAFLGALRTDVLDLGTSEFAPSGDKWQEFLTSGITDTDEIMNGDVSQESLANDALTKSILWVGKEVMEELKDNPNWDGPSAAEMDSSDLAETHQVYEVTYVNDGNQVKRLVTEDELADLAQDHRDGTIQFVASEGIEGYLETFETSGVSTAVNRYEVSYIDENGTLQKVDDLNETQVGELQEKHANGEIVITKGALENPIQARMFWAKRALAFYDVERTPTYDAQGNLLSAPSADDRVAQAFHAVYTHYEDAGVLTKTAGYKAFLGHTHHGTSLNPLLNTATISTTPTVTDAEANAFMYDKLGVEAPVSGVPPLAHIFAQWKGAVSIVEVAAHFAQNERNHPDHARFTGKGNGEHAEDAGDAILDALEDRGRFDPSSDDPDDTLAFSSSREVSNGIRENRMFSNAVLGIDAVVIAGTAVITVLSGGATAPLLGEEVAGAGAFDTAIALATEEKVFAADGLLFTTAYTNLMAAAVSDGGFVALFTNTIASPVVVGTFGTALAAGNIQVLTDNGIATTPVVAGGDTETNVYRIGEDGKLVLVKETDATSGTSHDDAIGGTLAEQINTINLALQVTEIYETEGADAAVDFLRGQVSTETPGVILDVLQWLGEGPRDAVESKLLEDAEADFEDFAALLGEVDPTTDRGRAALASLLNNASPAVARAAILHLQDEYGVGSAADMLAYMKPDKAAALLLHDQDLSLNSAAESDNSDDGTTVLQLSFVFLAEHDPEAAGEIFGKMGEADPVAAGQFLIEVLDLMPVDMVARFAVFGDPVHTAEAMAKALEVEADKAADNWSPTTDSQVLELGRALLVEGAANGMNDRIEAMVTAFLIVQDTLPPEMEENYLVSLNSQSSIKIGEYLDDPVSLYDELGGDLDAGKMIIVRFGEMGTQDAANSILGNYTSSSSGGGGGLDDLSDIMSQMGVRAAPIMAAVADSKPGLVNDLIMRLPPTTQGQEISDEWQAEISQSNTVSFLGIDGDFDYVVDTISMITGVDREVVRKLMAGELTLEEGAEAKAYTITEKLQEALADPTHVHHGSATAMMDRIGKAALGAGDWQGFESDYLNNMINAATSGTSFEALSNLLVGAITGVIRFIEVIKDGAANDELADYLENITEEELFEDHPELKQQMEDFDKLYEEQMVAFFESDEGRAILTQDGFTYKDGEVYDQEGRALQAPERQSRWGRHWRLDLALEISIDVKNQKGSIADTAIQARINYSPRRNDADGHSFHQWRFRVLTQGALTAKGWGKLTGGQINTGPITLREFALSVYSEGENVRDIRTEINTLNDNVDNAQFEVDNLKLEVGILNNQITPVKGALGRLTGSSDPNATPTATSELGTVETDLATSYANIETTLREVTPTVSTIYIDEVEEAWGDRDKVFADAASTEKQIADAETAVDTALGRLEGAALAATTNREAAEENLTRVRADPMSTSAQRQAAQTAVTDARKEENATIQLSRQANDRSGELSQRIRINLEISGQRTRLNTLQGQLDALNTKLGEATTALQTATTARDDDVPTLETDLDNAIKKDPGRRRGDLMYQSTSGVNFEPQNNLEGGPWRRIAQSTSRWAHNQFSDESRILTIPEAETNVANALTDRNTAASGYGLARVAHEQISEDLEATRRELNEANATVDETYYAYQTAIETRNSAQARVERLEAKKTELENKLGELDADKTEIQEELDQVNEDLGLAKQELSDAETNVTVTETAHNTAKTEFDTAKQNFDTAKDNVDQARTILEGKRLVVNNLNEQVGGLLEEEANLLSERAAIQNGDQVEVGPDGTPVDPSGRLREIDIRLGQIDTALAALPAEIQEAEREAEIAEGELQIAEDVFDQAANALGGADAELQKSRQDYDTARDDRGAAINKVENLEQRRQALRRQLDSVDTTAERREIEGELRQVDLDLRSARDELGTAEAEVTRTRRAYNRAQGAVTVIQRQLDNQVVEEGRARTLLKISETALEGANERLAIAQQERTLAINFESNPSAIEDLPDAFSQYNPERPWTLRPADLEGGYGGGITTVYNLNELRNNGKNGLFLMDIAGGVVGGALGGGTSWLLAKKFTAQDADQLVTWQQKTKAGVINTVTDPSAWINFGQTVGSVTSGLITATANGNNDQIASFGSNFFYAAYKPRIQYARPGSRDPNSNQWFPAGLLGGRLQINWSSEPALLT